MTQRDPDQPTTAPAGPDPSQPRVAVIGGGIAGLSAAWEAVRSGAAVTVYESASHWGGKLRTSTVDGVLVDESADAFLARVPFGTQLCDELGISDQLISPAHGNALIWWDGKHQPFPGGLALGVPIDPQQVTDCAFLSPEAADQVRAEMDRTGPGVDSDVSVGAYMRDHFGDEITDRLIEPLLGGINAAEIDMLGMDTVAPQLGQAARAGASIVNAIRAQQASTPPDPSAPVFLTHPDGLGALVDTLVDALRDHGVTLRSNTSVAGLATSADGSYVLDTVQVDSASNSNSGGTADSSTAGFDGVVIAIPANWAAGLLDRCAPAVAAHCRSLRYASVVVVTMSYDAENVPEVAPAAGLLVPRSGPFHTTAVSFASCKWPHQERSGRVLFRVSMGHYSDPEPVRWDDEQLLSTVRAELAQLLGIEAEPVEVRISRWPDGFPQYEPGHLLRLAEIEAALAAAAPGITLAGASFHGIGVPTCIRSGRGAASAALAALT